jgi:flagellar basal body-associated protein FliL
MSRKNYIIVGILALITLLVIVGIFVLDGLSSMGNPNGSRTPDYPYFMTTEPLTVKKIGVPKLTIIGMMRSDFPDIQWSI